MRQRMKRWIVSLVVLLPDERKHWAVYAAFAAIRQIRQRRIEYVLTSAPPFSVHFIGLAARALTGARWFADFRDPWIDMLWDRYPYTRSRLSDRLEKWMEAMVVRTADRVVCTTPRMQEAFRARYPRVPADRFTVIQNSIDTDKIQPGAAPDKYCPLTITYAGTLYWDRTPEPLFRAVEQLIEAGRIEPSGISIKLVGRCRSINDLDTMDVARKYGLTTVVEVIDAVPYREAIQIMQKSHLLLVLAPNHHRLVVPAKVYDYLGSGTKILALTGAGATSDLIDETGSGRCFSPDDVAGLREYLAELLQEGRFRDLRNEPGSFARYEMRRLTERLVAEMSGEIPDGAEEAVVRT
jgi:glycosyltransferase involved in cell wall biosynthesis